MENDLSTGAQKIMVRAMLSPGVLPHSPITSDKDRCSASEGRATFAQAIVYEACRKLSNGPGRGLLVYHATGAGKTCAAVAAMAAFWDTPRKFIYCAMHDGLRSVAPAELVKCAKNYFPNIAKIPDIESQLEKRITRITMTQLSHELQLYRGRQVRDSVERVVRSSQMNESLIVLDEVHNLFRPLPQHRSEHGALLQFLLSDDARAANIKIIVMTATPGSTPLEMCNLLNIVRDRRRPPIVEPKDASELDAFSKSAEGLVSFVDAARDTSVFPIVARQERVESHMSELQWDKYLEKLMELPDVEADFDRLLSTQETHKYWASARKYANSLFDKQPNMQLADFSCKLPQLLQNIKSYPKEKHYVYSAFHTRTGWGGHGIHMVARCLREMEKYTQLKVEDAIRMVAAKELPPPGLRFIMLTSSDLSGESNSKTREEQAVYSLLKIFNHSSNARGALVHVVLASQTYNEAVDLHGVRHIHLMEPMLTAQAEQQAVGRAVRRCSHASLDRGAGEWTVTVRRYFAMPPSTNEMHALSDKELQELKAELAEVLQKEQNAPPDSTEKEFYSVKGKKLAQKVESAERAKRASILLVDDVIYNEAQQRARQMELMETALRRAAIDCLLTKTFHDMKVACTSEQT